ncbi:MAG: hypothetical protein JNK02_16100 [Planctomycetes bacterium]|nr:hypothetical protein [Planctomycetota bacterium]
MSPARRAPPAGSGRRPAGRTLHRALIAAESVLVLGVLKDWVWRQVLASTLPSSGKVALAMLTTIGLFGGFYVLVQRLFARGVSTTHRVAGRLPLLGTTLFVHAALLYVLFLLYARMLGLQVPTPFSP